MCSNKLLNVELLNTGYVLESDIYRFGTDVVLYKKGTVLDENKINRLKKFGNISIVVNSNEDIKVNKTNQEIIVRNIEMDFRKLYKCAKYIVLSVLNKKEVKEILSKVDCDTYFHSYQVAITATMIAINLEGFKQTLLEELAITAIMHDVGKTLIDFSILNKPGKLTAREYETVKLHSQYGYDILSNTGLFSEDVCNSVLLHHENEDGSGYPYHKKGDEITLYARIIHLADVYSALTSQRSYKDKWSSLRAFEQLEKEKHKFEPQLLEVLKTSLPFYMKDDVVCLSTNELATIIDATSNYITVKLFGEKKIVNISQEEAKMYIKRKIKAG